MADAKIISLGIGIALILAIFAGFLSWQVSDSQQNSCKAIEVKSMTCCKWTGSTETFWTDSSNSCVTSNGGVVGATNCNLNNYSSTSCSSVFKQYFGIISIIIGIIALALGIFLKTNLTIEGGLIGGGIICFIMALISFWDYLQGWIRVIAAGVILLGLIVLAWYKTKD